MVGWPNTVNNGTSYKTKRIGHCRINYFPLWNSIIYFCYNAWFYAFFISEIIHKENSLPTNCRLLGGVFLDWAYTLIKALLALL